MPVTRAGDTTAMRCTARGRRASATHAHGEQRVKLRAARRVMGAARSPRGRAPPRRMGNPHLCSGLRRWPTAAGAEARQCRFPRAGDRDARRSCGHAQLSRRTAVPLRHVTALPPQRHNSQVGRVLLFRIRRGAVAERFCVRTSPVAWVARGPRGCDNERACAARCCSIPRRGEADWAKAERMAARTQPMATRVARPTFRCTAGPHAADPLHRHKGTSPSQVHACHALRERKLRLSPDGTDNSRRLFLRAPALSQGDIVVHHKAGFFACFVSNRQPSRVHSL